MPSYAIPFRNDPTTVDLWLRLLAEAEQRKAISSKHVKKPMTLHVVEREPRKHRSARASAAEVPRKAPKSIGSTDWAYDPDAYGHPAPAIPAGIRPYRLLR